MADPRLTVLTYEYVYLYYTYQTPQESYIFPKKHLKETTILGKDPTSGNQLFVALSIL